MSGFFTVTLNFATAFLFTTDVTVIVAVPAFFAVTFPLDETVATFLLLDANFTPFALMPFKDFTLTVAVFPTAIVTFFFSSVILAFCFFLLTVTLIVPFTLAL